MESFESKSEEDLFVADLKAMNFDITPEKEGLLIANAAEILQISNKMYYEIDTIPLRWQITLKLERLRLL